MPIPPEDIADSLERVLASATFARAQRARELLAWLVRRAADDDRGALKEASIALDVFGRDAATYDSSTDGVVRVAVNRLRELLDRYYEGEGRSDAVRIEIPRGGYAPLLRRQTPPTLPAQPRLAVLPLANFTGLAEVDALCDALTEDIIDALTRLPDLRVIARTSSFHYRNVHRDVRRIAQELAVDALLEGSVQKDGALLRVTAQLVLGSDGSHVWSHTFVFERERRHVLLDAVIDLMVRSLHTASTQPAGADSTYVPTKAPSAAVQSLIDQARGLNVTQSSENLPLAEAIAERATLLDPYCADAWFVLAMVRFSRRASLSVQSSASSDSVETALERALALDRSHAAARSLWAYVAICTHQRWTDGLAAARAAVAMAPHHGGINGRLAYICLALGLHDEAVGIYDRVLALDPLAPPAHYHRALGLMLAQRLDDAAQALEAARQSLGESDLHLHTLCTWHECRGDDEAALATAEQALQRYPFAVAPLMHGGRALARRGDMAAARRMAARFSGLRDAARHYACAYIESGGTDTAACFDHLDHVAHPPEPLQMMLPIDPVFRPLHTHPRWQSLLRAMRHPSSPTALTD